MRVAILGSVVFLCSLFGALFMVNVTSQKPGCVERGGRLVLSHFIVTSTRSNIVLVPIYECVWSAAPGART